LAIVDISGEVLRRVKGFEALGTQVISFNVDPTRLFDVREMVGRVWDRYGRIDILVNVAGLCLGEPQYQVRAPMLQPRGVSGLTKALALEVAGYGITVNAIAPGWIHTDSSSESEVKAGLSTPMRRSGTAEEVANLVLFLASDESSYMTGHDVVIDGGNVLQEYKGLEPSS
jgi:NAD(P)-dependent dehydrogenase (short-subunit alcohol dehydrogenase family)